MYDDSNSKENLLNLWEICDEGELNDKETLLFQKLEAFNSRYLNIIFAKTKMLIRKLSLEEKNLFLTSPVASPLLKIKMTTSCKIRKSADKSLTFISLTPLLTGFNKTIKSICTNEEDLHSHEESINEVSMVSTLATGLISQEFKLIKKLK